MWKVESGEDLIDIGRFRQNSNGVPVHVWVVLSADTVVVMPVMTSSVSVTVTTAPEIGGSLDELPETRRNDTAYSLAFNSDALESVNSSPKTAVSCFD